MTTARSRTADMLDHEGDAAAIIDAARTGATYLADTPITDAADRLTLVTLDEDRHLVLIDNENALPAPRRQRGTTKLASPDGFVRWVASHAGDSVDLYADPHSNTRTLTAVLNPHRPDSPSWEDHRAELPALLDPRFARWLAVHTKVIRQAAFAEHVQECAADIAQPAAMDLLEVAETLALNVGAEVSSAQRLQDGARRFVFKESVDATAGYDREVEVPDTLLLRVPVFFGQDPLEVGVRLLYRKVDQGVGFLVQIVDLDLLLMEQFEALTDDVAERLGVQPMLGTPPPPLASDPVVDLIPPASLLRQER